MAKELTLVFFKPDAMKKNIQYKVIERFHNAGLEVVAIKYALISEKQFDEHYGHVSGYDFYEDMKEYIVGHKLLFIVLLGEDAINRVREMIGPTRNAPEGTIRGDYGSESFRNLIHASDSYESANKEIVRFFC